ncbi:Colicin V production protein [Paramagnetospirillum magnetotacticum MS-1]|uniref:Colicin V production protein n=1 Tax=Paramagnetospirillum magnetotacticum MS-1 TaxID=272627 RepID=A0A0C2YV14_PARME|nr:CvpA family protein [Paramagnetospirillum magnetotacticum]KIL98540.1 Colicin V production protein [Paramagnetospirillum magnetotacticum MS-1]
MGNLNTTAVDIVVAVVLLGSAGFAFLRGFVQEVLSITSWVGAVFAALYGFPHAQPFFRSHIGSTIVADIAAGACLFLVTLLILSLLTKRVSDTVKRSALNSVDSSLGFVFGLARGAVLVSLAYMSAAWLFDSPEQQPDWLAQSRSRPWLMRGAATLQSLAPEGLGKAEGKAEGKAKEASSEARQLMEAEKTFQKFISPQPAAANAHPAADGKAPGKPAAKPDQTYDNESRTQMERLIRTQQ